ncbi:hypothetical protein [Bordetella sp. BOR01]|uniref:hypothetical protein n=1 Tax=Bordetella sp. BOR01 TaxID=2854779 RepID=UPI001C446D19|nr:hypothetical protein [Bordetella sp. BOR01]MBV7486423.1 hypothetical protein [Bordetella sp. BOR01]
MTPPYALFDAAALEKLADLIDRMMHTSRGKDLHSDDIGRRIDRLQRGSSIGMIGLALVAALLAMVQKWMTAPPGWLGSIIFVLAMLIVLISIGSLAAMLYFLCKTLWQHRKQPDQAIFAHIRADLHGDALYLAELSRLPRPILEYALLQYQHHTDDLGKRVALLAGDITRIGLFPGILALSVSALKLAESQANLWFWTPLILAGCFYLLAFAVIAPSRRAQVIRLLQYAIDHAPAPGAVPPGQIAGAGKAVSDTQGA